MTSLRPASPGSRTAPPPHASTSAPGDGADRGSPTTATANPFAATSPKSAGPHGFRLSRPWESPSTIISVMQRSTALVGDSNGDTVADFEIVLFGHIALTASDFVLQ